MKLIDFVHFFVFLFGMMVVFALADIVFAYKTSMTYGDMMSFAAMATIIGVIREKR